ncbi:MAG: transcription initiation factor IIB, partial [Nitrosopumilus sp.]|nr:transcription initiation factor IIB [Nitrosopumilus sp.]
MTILQKIEEVKLACNNCSVSQFITDDVIGEIACSGCGCIISENTEDRGAERRIFSDKSDNTRTGPGLSLKMHDRGLNTVIGTLNQDSTGKPLSSNTAQTFGRLRKWDSRSQTKNSADRSLRDALGELDKAQSKMGLSDIVIERASLFYRKASEKNLVRGRTVKGMAAACLYAACREHNIPRTLDDMADAGNVERRILSRDLRTIIKKLELHLN